MARGGKRPGAGRKRKEKLPLATKSIASEVLAKIDEVKWWLALLHSKDARLRFDVQKYLTDRRDGRPVQQVRVASPDSDKLKVEVDLVSAREKLLAKLGG
jgi:hypothetical protein